MDFIIYTDGGARGNPGPAGAGAYITDGAGVLVRECSRFLGHATNNIAEYEAVLLGYHELMQLVAEPSRAATKVEFRMDSELIQRQLIGKYKVKEPHLKKLHAQVLDLWTRQFPLSSFVHVRRADNAEADRLANDAMDRGA